MSALIDYNIVNGYNFLSVLLLDYFDLLQLNWNAPLPFSVATHLPFLFHIVTLLVSTGPLSLRSSTHGLVINIIHSLCTCSQLSHTGRTCAGRWRRISTGCCKKDVTPLLTHWSYIFLALTHRFEHFDTLRPEQNGCHLADDNFKFAFPI